MVSIVEFSSLLYFSGDDLAQVGQVEEMSQWRLQPDVDAEPLDVSFKNKFIFKIICQKYFLTP